MEPVLYTPRFFLANAIHLVALTSNGLFLLLPLFLKQGGLESWETGAVMAGASVASVLSRLVLGHPMDVWGRRPFILGGLGLSALVALLYLLVGQERVRAWAPLLAAIRFAQGIGLSSYFTAIVACVTDAAPRARLGEAVGIFGLSGLVTMATGSGLATFVLARGGFSGLFVAAAVGFSVAGALALRLPDESGASRERPPEREDAPASRGADVRASLSAFRATASSPSLHGPILSFFIFGASMSALATFISPFFQSLTGDARMLAPFFCEYVTAAAIVRVISGRMIDRLGHGRLVVPATIGMAIGMMALSRVTADGSLLSWSTLASLGLGFGHGVIYPSVTALAITRISDADRGKAISVTTASNDLGGILGAVAYGVVATQLGYRAMYLISGGVAALSILVYMGLEHAHAGRLRALA